MAVLVFDWNLDKGFRSELKRLADLSLGYRDDVDENGEEIEIELQIQYFYIMLALSVEGYTAYLKTSKGVFGKNMTKYPKKFFVEFRDRTLEKFDEGIRYTSVPVGTLFIMSVLALKGWQSIKDLKSFLDENIKRVYDP